MRYRVSTALRGERTIYTLHDDATGASAAILPSFGFNLFDLRLPAAGRLCRVIAASDDFPEDPSKPGRNGTPILFPYPNRVRDGRFQFQGREYRLPLTKPPNAIHGFALNVPWDAVAQDADDTEASLTGLFQISKHAPEMRSHWPADAALRVRYALSGRCLTMTIRVTNPSAEDLPYGFGIHPYFHLPLTPGGDPADTAVILPASQYWVLRDSLPTGERRAVDDRLDFRQGKPRKGLKLDDVLTGLDFEDAWCVCRLVDRALQAEFRVCFDRSFRELVVFTPPERDDLIALEPYTQTTDAINLESRGIDAGLRQLGPDQEHTMTIRMETVG